MQNLDSQGFQIVMHVHDEIVCEMNHENEIDRMCEIMSQEAHWAPGLPNRADGFVAPYYRKAD
jgi:DNA polymerase